MKQFDPKRRRAALATALQISFQILQNLHGRIASTRTHDAAARMRGRSAHVEILNWRAILGPARRRPQKEKLFQTQFALKDISFRQTKLAFEIERRQNLSMKNNVTDVGCMFSDRIDHRIAELFTLFVPRSFLQVVRRVLNEA